ncbi:TLD-domain-containing protein [Phlyctochytrium arcticum]|nr:TLD-domain-containing protein [Phlyctochytrium arcticum]
MARPPLSLQGRDSTVVEPVLDIDTAEQIRNHLPPLLKETQRWELVYSMEQHGISLNTLFKRSEEQGGAVLFVLRDADDGIFGAFGTESIHIKTGYYGTGFCFLWKKDPSKASDDTNEPSKVAVYPATGENDYFMLSEPHFIAFGGGDGGFGLWIDDELFNGHSGPCQTFRNDQLSVKPEFELVALELWSISI